MWIWFNSLKELNQIISIQYPLPLSKYIQNSYSTERIVPFYFEKEIATNSSRD